jgi:uncharacterized membrane protein YqjE
VIALSYFAIPFCLMLLYKNKSRDLPKPFTLILFITFIVLCGMTHVADVVVFFWAPYRLYALLAAMTAVASAFTAIRLPGIIRYLCKLPSREYVHKINNQLQAEVLMRAQAEHDLAQRNDKLRARAQMFEDLLHQNALKTLDDLQRTNTWIHERNRAMDELEKMISELEVL